MTTTISTRRFSVPFATHSFPPNAIQINSPLRFYTAELAHALFVTGRAPGDRAAFGNASVWEFIHRASIIPSYVRRSNNGRLVRSALARQLDRSEKGNLSYALGQAMAGVFCRQALGANCLLHVDRYAQRFNVVFGAGRSRPDLIGFTPRGWIVTEAKGRSNSMEASLRGKLASQKRAIATIEGQPPFMALGCVASFPQPPAWSRRRQSMYLQVFDPSEDEPESIDVEIDLERFLIAYYEPFVAAIDAGERLRTDDRYVVSTLNGIGVSVGLRTEIYNTVSAQEIDVAPISAILDRPERRLDTDEFPDGTIVRTEWSDAIGLEDYDLESEA